MAITSVGYAGTVNDVQWATLLPYGGGAEYAVVDTTDFRVTSGGSGDRAVTVAPGVAIGMGVMDMSDSSVVLNAAAASSVRFDLVGLVRDWATAESSLAIIPGGSAQAIPSRPVNPGIEDVQPLALIRVDPGSSVVQVVADLRVWVGPGGAVAQSPLVRGFLSRPGTRIRIGDDEHVRGFASNGAATWHSTRATPTFGQMYNNVSQGMTNAGWTTLGFAAGSSIFSGGVSKVGNSMRVPVTGLYLVVASLSFDQGSSGQRQLRIRRSATVIGGAYDYTQTVANMTQHLQVARQVPLSEGDQVVADGYRSGGGALTSYARRLSVSLIG